MASVPVLLVLALAVGGGALDLRDVMHGLQGLTKGFASRLPTISTSFGTSLSTLPSLSTLTASLSDLPNLVRMGARLQSNDTEKHTSRCYGDLGCFSIDGKFFSIARPVNLFPVAPEVIGVKINLYTKYNPNIPVIFSNLNDVTEIKSSVFNTSVPSKFIVHGFIENGNMPWILAMKDELLVHGDYNVLTVDWRVGALPPYTQAVANARIVGAILAKYINLLQGELQYPPDQCHIIGHSLGSHIAGYAGERIRYLGRISGLDPAGPYFEFTDPVVRLDPSDALFVDVIHTDASSILNRAFGIFEPCGHVDFYPNGGLKQPGCESNVMHALEREDGDLYRGMRHWVGCRHTRSYEYFTESINGKCSFLAFACPQDEDVSPEASAIGNLTAALNVSAESRMSVMGNATDVSIALRDPLFLLSGIGSMADFERARCTSCGHNGQYCARMGYWSSDYIQHKTNDSVRMYLKTNAQPPYCTHHYKVVVQTGRGPLHDDGISGILLIKLEGDKFKSEFTEIASSEVSMESGKSYAFVIGSRVAAAIRRIQLQLVKKPSVFDHLGRLFFGEPQVNVGKVSIHSMETGKRYLFCGDGRVLKSSKIISLYPRLSCL